MSVFYSVPTCPLYMLERGTRSGMIKRPILNQHSLKLVRGGDPTGNRSWVCVLFRYLVESDGAVHLVLATLVLQAVAVVGDAGLGPTAGLADGGAPRHALQPLRRSTV